MESLNRFQNYQVIKPIGSGGMSTVYQAVDDKLKRNVALKMLHPHLCSEPLAVERFRREALSAAKLDHPNIVRIYDYVIENSVHCIVMEFVPGLDMETIIKRRGKLDFKTAYYVMHKVALAIKAAHQTGLMHRDVKPSNILVHEDGRVMLSDFGLVKHSMDVSLTVDNAVAGTPAFMSPEQISGRKVNYSSDIYSWAVTFYYLLAGALPYSAKEFAEVVYAIQAAKVQLDKNITDAIPVKFYELISRCLLADPGERLQNGGELLKWLGSVPPPQEIDLVRMFDLPQSPSASRYMTEQISRTRVFYASWFGRRRRIAGIVSAGILLAGALFLVNQRLHKKAVPSGTAAAVSVNSPDQIKPLTKDTLAPVEARREKPVSRPLQKSGAARGAADTSAQKGAAPAPDSGKLFIACDPWANVTVDGRDFGQTPLPSPIPLPAGRHALKLANPYSENLEDSVTIVRDEVLRKHYTLKVKPAYSQPSGKQ